MVLRCQAMRVTQSVLGRRVIYPMVCLRVGTFGRAGRCARLLIDVNVGIHLACNSIGLEISVNLSSADGLAFGLVLIPEFVFTNTF